MDAGTIGCAVAIVLALAIPMALLFAPQDEAGELTPSAARWFIILGNGFIVTAIIVYLWAGNATGRTPGRLLMGLTVVRMDTGERLGVNWGLARTIAQVMTMATLGLGYAMALFDPQRRAFHDRLVQTLVIEA
jgi:uncharacterized RDD family membrane protein YckC